MTQHSKHLFLEVKSVYFSVMFPLVVKRYVGCILSGAQPPPPNPPPPKRHLVNN